jgi:hypothetical protein
MRVQFNAKTFVVEPAYRDDNRGLWDFGEQQSGMEMEAEMMFDSAQIKEQPEQDHTPPDDERQELEQSDDTEASPISVQVVEEDFSSSGRRRRYSCSAVFRVRLHHWPRTTGMDDYCRVYAEARSIAHGRKYAGAICGCGSAN